MPPDPNETVSTRKILVLLSMVLLAASLVCLVAVGTVTTLLRWHDERSDKDALKRLAGLRRTAWVPVTKEGDGPASASKFSGIAWLGPNEAWPACPNCKKPMQLFLQLNLKEAPQLPKGCPKEGLLQFFYCTTATPNCESECNAGAPFAKSVLIRMVQPAGVGARLTESPVEGAFPPRTITGWTSRDDYPNGEEMKAHGVVLSDPQLDKLSGSFPVTGDKLLGWPAWVQGVEYPQCPECGQRMGFFLQIDSEKNLPHLFGDAGCGHITQCPKHPNRLAFAWACY